MTSIALPLLKETMEPILPSRDAKKVNPYVTVSLNSIFSLRNNRVPAVNRRSYDSAPIKLKKIVLKAPKIKLVQQERQALPQVQKLPPEEAAAQKFRTRLERFVHSPFLAQEPCELLEILVDIKSNLEKVNLKTVHKKHNPNAKLKNALIAVVESFQNQISAPELTERQIIVAIPSSLANVLTQEILKKLDSSGLLTHFSTRMIDPTPIIQACLYATNRKMITKEQKVVRFKAIMEKLTETYSYSIGRGFKGGKYIVQPASITVLVEKILNAQIQAADHKNHAKNSLKALQNLMQTSLLQDIIADLNTQLAIPKNKKPSKETVVIQKHINTVNNFIAYIEVHIQTAKFVEKLSEKSEYLLPPDLQFLTSRIQVTAQTPEMLMQWFKPVPIIFDAEMQEELNQLILFIQGKRKAIESCTFPAFESDEYDARVLAAENLMKNLNIPNELTMNYRWESREKTRFITQLSNDLKQPYSSKALAQEIVAGCLIPLLFQKNQMSYLKDPNPPIPYKNASSKRRFSGSGFFIPHILWEIQQWDDKKSESMQTIAGAKACPVEIEPAEKRFVLKNSVNHPTRSSGSDLSSSGLFKPLGNREKSKKNPTTVNGYLIPDKIPR